MREGGGFEGRGVLTRKVGASRAPAELDRNELRWWGVWVRWVSRRVLELCRRMIALLNWGKKSRNKNLATEDAKMRLSTPLSPLSGDSKKRNR